MAVNLAVPKAEDLHPVAGVELGVAMAGVRKANSIEELLKHADFVTLHLPLVPATRGLVNAELLAKMKPGSTLINCARDSTLMRTSCRSRCARLPS